MRQRNRASSILVGLLLVSALVAAGCSDDDDTATSSGSESSGKTIAVPKDQATIQAAVDAAKPGDLILISPGIYKEGVTVETKNLVIRGTDRNKVIIDGEFTRENGIKVLADGVAVENLTARNNTANGVFWTGSYEDNYVLKGYRASYVTAYNNGLYGVYAFNASNGLMEHSYASGHPDSGFYIGQCNPCNAVLRDLTAERNLLGYSGTNSSGNLTIVSSVFRNNRAGIVPNSLKSEKLAPQSGDEVVANLVVDNNSAEAPSSESFGIAYGNGILIGGGSKNNVTRNVIRGHKNAGVVVTDLPDNFKPEGNKVTDNEMSENTFDLVYLITGFPPEAYGNCFEGNTPSAPTSPDNIEKELPCGGAQAGSGWDLGSIIAKIAPAPPSADWKTVAAPDDQKNMPDATTAPTEPAIASDLPPKVDLAKAEVPEG